MTVGGVVLLGVLPTLVQGQAKTLQPVTPGEALQAIASYKNNVVLVDFWATWCGPCRAELPHLVQLERELHDKGLRLIIISMDEMKEMSAATQFLDSIGAGPARYIRAPRSTDSAWVASIDPTWGGSLPGTFLYGRSGEKYIRFRGEPPDLEQIKRVVTKIVALPPTHSPAQQSVSH